MTFDGYGRIPDGVNTPTEILASTDGLEKMGILLTKEQGVLEKGTVLGIVTATKRAVPYDKDAVDGSAVAVGILSDAFDTRATGKGDDDDVKLAANMYIHGSFKADALTGLDATAITSLKARQIGNVLTF